MRKLSEITDPILPAPLRVRSFDRRPLPRLFAQLTCLVLVLHQESEDGHRLLVSDDGDAVGAVWLPKAMLVIDPADRGRFLVVTLSAQFAAERQLSVRFIDPAKFCDAEREALADAVATAARVRLRLRGHRDPLPFPGRNAFA